MAIYVYRCACGRSQEKIRKITEREHPVQCNNFGCNELATLREIAPSLIYDEVCDSLLKED